MLKRYGNKLYIGGKLSLEEESTPLSERIEYLYVEGKIEALKAQIPLLEEKAHIYCKKFEAKALLSLWPAFIVLTAGVAEDCCMHRNRRGRIIPDFRSGGCIRGCRMSHRYGDVHRHMHGCRILRHGDDVRHDDCSGHPD